MEKPQALAQLLAPEYPRKRRGGDGTRVKKCGDLGAEELHLTNSTTFKTNWETSLSWKFTHKDDRKPRKSTTLDILLLSTGLK